MRSIHINPHNGTRACSCQMKSSGNTHCALLCYIIPPQKHQEFYPLLSIIQFICKIFSNVLFIWIEDKNNLKMANIKV